MPEESVGDDLLAALAGPGPIKAAGTPKFSEALFSNVDEFLSSFQGRFGRIARQLGHIFGIGEASEEVRGDDVAATGGHDGY